MLWLAGSDAAQRTGKETVPLEVLKRGHSRALRAVEELEHVLELLRRGEGEKAVAAVRGLLGFLEGEQELHFRQEEEGLFLYLARVTGEGPVRAMVGEHDSYRKAVSTLKALLQEAGDATPLERLLVNITALLREHIRKEETAFFPLAEERLSPEQLRAVDEEMEAIARLG